MDIEGLASQIINMYLAMKIDKLVIIYNHFINSLTYETKVEELLPIKEIIGNESKIDYEYEGGPIKILDMLLPIYVKDIIYGIILDAKCSEHSARMNSMRNASDNAKEVIDQLQLLYNRARQNVITNELIDIIGGANAIGGDN
jgi:F-type H+-transporting ATPase subunit gamma